jgi:hypothetical protein
MNKAKVVLTCHVWFGMKKFSELHPHHIVHTVVDVRLSNKISRYLRKASGGFSENCAVELRGSGEACSFSKSVRT